MKKNLLRFVVLCMVAVLVAGAFPAAAGTAANGQVAGGHLHFLAVKPDGTLWGWGSNFSGQLGNGESGNDARRDKPIKIMKDVKAAAAGTDHSLALKTDGSLWAFGGNRWGELGDGTYTDRLKPVKIMDNVKYIDAGSNVSLAIKTDGSLWTWGNNFSGGLGGGTVKDLRSTPEKIMENVKFAATSGERTFVIKADDSLWAWGANYNGELLVGKKAQNKYATGHVPDKFDKPFKVMEDVKTVATGGEHTLIVKKDGTLWTVGYNSAYQLGDGTDTDRLKPVKVLDNVAAVTGGGYHSLALKKDGTLWAWGSTQLPGNSSHLEVPTYVMDNVVAVSTQGTSAVAMKSDGSVWFWRASAKMSMAGEKDETGKPEKIL